MKIFPRPTHYFLLAAMGGLAFARHLPAQTDPAPAYKARVVADVEAMRKQTQVMIDTLFSFGELGFQEFETSKYLTGILEKEGFTVERGIAGLPTACRGVGTSLPLAHL